MSPPPDPPHASPAVVTAPSGGQGSDQAWEGEGRRGSALPAPVDHTGRTVRGTQDPTGSLHNRTGPGGAKALQGPPPNRRDGLKIPRRTTSEEPRPPRPSFHLLPTPPPSGGGDTKAQQDLRIRVPRAGAWAKDYERWGIGVPPLGGTCPGREARAHRSHIELIGGGAVITEVVTEG